MQSTAISLHAQVMMRMILPYASASVTGQLSWRERILAVMNTMAAV